MSTLLEKQIQVNRILALTSEQAKALEDHVRAKILKILYKKTLSAEQIYQELNKTGYKKALTTIRHHIDILRQSGLIEVVKIKETRGAITKFYGTTIKLLVFSAPKDFDAKYSTAIAKTSTKMEKVLKSIVPKPISKSTQKIVNPEEYSQYLLLEIVNRAMTNVLEKNETTFQQMK